MAREIQRNVLPIPDQPSFGLVTYDARDPDTSFPPVEPLRPPKGAPNVLAILLDDVGFGAASAFGGPCSTPTAERLADGGLKYTRFHTTALCAPTRKALLTGRNHHSAAMGSITDIGEDYGMPVSSDYAGNSSKFNGKIDLVQIDLGDDNHDHLIDPEEIVRIAFARQ
jgi:Sulfatase